MILVPLAVCLMLSCRQAPGEDRAPTLTPAEEKDMLMRVNKFLWQQDIELINSYVTRRGWEMQVSESGLFYEIYEQTNGDMVKEGMKISMAYKLSLLDGTLCYSSDKDGQKEFLVGKSQEVSGLELGLVLMREGEKARFIIPPHLAYGLLGDEKRIPAGSIIVYEVEMLKVNSPS